MVLAPEVASPGVAKPKPEVAKPTPEVASAVVARDPEVASSSMSHEAPHLLNTRPLIPPGPLAHGGDLAEHGQLVASIPQTPAKVLVVGRRGVGPVSASAIAPVRMGQCV